MGKIIYILGLLLIGLVGVPSVSYSQNSDVFNNSGLPIPRFVSLRSDKVFVRTGPALRYPIKWIYVREGMPVEIVQEFDTWRKIQDMDGEEGWIHQSLLSGRRNAIVIEEGDDVFLYRKPEMTSKKMAMVEHGNLANVEKCVPDWCEVEVKSFSGWIERKSLWGVYPDEEFD